MFEKILFATDFSAYAKKALDCIAGFPKAREVFLVYICEDVRSPRGGGEIGNTFCRNENNLLKEQKRYLECLNKDLRVTTVIKTSSDTAGAIIRAAEERDVSLIVIGARGNSLIDEVLLGSVSGAVLRRSKTSVLIMRHKIVEGLKGKTYEMCCPMILSRVLCPVDFSRFSDNAVAVLSKTPNISEVILLHVVSRGETESELDDAVRKAKDHLAGACTCLAGHGIRARGIVRTGNPAAEIVRTADEENVSVIWMSSYGKGWFHDFLIGSTAYTVTLNVRQPVMIIRSPEFPKTDGPMTSGTPEDASCHILP